MASVDITDLSEVGTNWKVISQIDSNLDRGVGETGVVTQGGYTNGPDIYDLVEYPETEGEGTITVQRETEYTRGSTSVGVAVRYNGATETKDYPT